MHEPKTVTGRLTEKSAAMKLAVKLPTFRRRTTAEKKHIEVTQSGQS